MPPVDATPEAVAAANAQERSEAFAAFARAVGWWSRPLGLVLVALVTLALVLTYPLVMLYRDLRTARANAARRAAELERFEVSRSGAPDEVSRAAAESVADLADEPEGLDEERDQLRLVNGGGEL